MQYRQPEIMRTTLNLSSDLLNAANRTAAAYSLTLGDVISELALTGLEAQSQPVLTRKIGSPVFAVAVGASTSGLQDVKRDEGGDD
jgi:ABC-type cobalamin transport system permease subunit